LKYEYRFPGIPELEDVSVYVENKGKQLKTEIKGKFPRRLWLLTKYYFKVFSLIRPLVKSPEGNLYSLYLPPIPRSAHARLFSSTISSVHYRRALPLAVTIGVENACQYQCVHCSASRRSESKPMLSLEEICRVVRECLDMGISNITFTGGEPFSVMILRSVLARFRPNWQLTRSSLMPLL